MFYPIGRTGFHVSAVMVRDEHHIRAELYMQGDKAKGALSLLKQQKAAIEEELGSSLRWDEMGREARVAAQLDGADPEDRNDWPRQHEWLAKRLNDIHRTFAGRVRALRLD
jgi:hypothetical protein